MTEKNFLDKMFDGADAIIGGIEESKKLSDPYPEEEKHEDNDSIDAEFSHTNKRADIIWGVDKENHNHHIFEGFKTTALCGRFFDAHQLGNRKTELDDGAFKCCGGCIRQLQAKYRNA
jgi:hypothetical protein